MKILVFGTFDHLHPGHRFLLDEASKRGELHVVVARDANVMRIKNRAPLQTEEERRDTIARAYPQATVMMGNPENFLSPIQDIKPDLILLGYDQQLPPGIGMDDLGCDIERLPAFHPEKFKSSLLRKNTGISE